MTVAHRAFLGAIIGAVVALFIHPLSRPWLQYGLWNFRPSTSVQSSPALAGTLKALPPPKSDDAVSLYVQVAAERMAIGDTLSEKDALLLAELTKSAAEKDPQNAYWRQSEAVFQYALMNSEAASIAWQRGARRTQWNDFQSTRIREFLNGFQRESGAAMAWHSACANHLRSSQVPRLIYSLGLALLQSDPSLTNRAVTFQNGILVRDFARSRPGSLYGYNLSERAATDPLNPTGNLKRKTFARAEFPRFLLESGQPELSKKVKQGLDENEAYQALVFSRHADRIAGALVGQSVLLAALPGALIIGAMACAAIFAALSLAPLTKLGEPLSREIVGAIAFGLALVTYGVTRNVSLSFWVLLSLSLFGIRPPFTLQSLPGKISPSVKALAMSYGLLLAAGVIASVVVSSIPFYHLKESLRPGWWLDPWSFLTHYFLLVTGFYLIVTQAMAYRDRRLAGRIAILSLKQSFAQVSVACLFACIVLTPFCIFLDNQVGSELQKIALNETAYYLHK
jgi:hypothetical protein